ncbi:MAG: SDR family NAD(P)-dependent oxidoreductase [Promethearchaeota archaeon]|jgi:NAD(P)-dependent dehydrogenase (short-subunit alcohol dehydrogenase family)
MIKEFEGKVAVVTGAGSGIGLSMALAFATKSMKVVLADIDERRLKRATRRLNKIGAEILSLKIDVSDPKQVENLANEAYNHFGRVNVLCNNAGIGGSGPLHLLELGDWDMTLETNLYGVIYGIKYFTKRMHESGESCHIVNTASVAGHLSTGENGPYAASKFAVVSISENLAQECFNTNVGVSVLCPGFINTNIAENTLALRANRTDLFELSDASEAAQIDLANFLSLIKLGMDPDIVAKMVIHAIENDIFYVMTHLEWDKYMQARLDRIKEDALKTRDAFPVAVREKKEIKYEYKTDTLSFSISYPDRLTTFLPSPNTSQVFIATEEMRQTIEVHVSEIEASTQLKDTTKIIADNLRSIGNEINIISSKQITLDDGTISCEAVIEYQRFGYTKMKSHHVSVIKDNKWVRISSSAHPYYFNDDLVKVTHSLNFSLPVAEIVL